MKIHSLRVFFLEQRNNIIFFFAATLGIATFIIVIIALSQIYEQSKQNERLLKSLSCILLIVPEDRTAEKIQDCIRINAGEDAMQHEFIFKTLTENKTVKSDDDFIKLVKEELRGDQGFRGSDGIDGTDGADGQDGETAISKITTIKEQMPIKGDKGDIGQAGREVEFQYNTLKDRLEWRYIGDPFWTVLVDACELTNTCP